MTEGWLTRRGVLAALAVGLATVWGFGWRGLALLLAFFISGSLLTRRDQGRRRDERQVIANGGVAALAALAGSWAGFVGALATATADTWASEIGRHSRTAPRLVTTGARVPAGTDGAMTLLGTAGGVVGAGFIAGLAVIVGPRSSDAAGAVAVAGIAGMLVDSLLGATVQGKVPWFDNDVVNLAATIAGAAIAAAAWQLRA